MRENLSERGKQILEAIIEDYIVTAEPVGSRTVTRRHGLTLSPASVRNVMSDLEELGFLASPHTSAGRVPTDKAYRFYVDSLLEVGQVASEQQEEIRNRCNLSGRDPGEMLKEASRLLSSLSQYMGIVVAPRFSDNLFRHIEFIKLSGKRLLAIFVSHNGTVQNKIIETDQDFRTADLARMANYLNHLLKGLSLTRVKEKILEEMQSDKVRYDLLMAQALRLSNEALTDTESEVFIGGQANILEQPEFADVGRMKDIFRAFEEKGQLLGLLDRCLEAQGVNIYIGAEAHLSQMVGMSLVTATYMTGKNSIGVLGVIGPTRMGYSRVIPIVDYTARLVSRLLEVD